MNRLLIITFFLQFVFNSTSFGQNYLSSNIKNSHFLILKSYDKTSISEKQDQVFIQDFNERFNYQELKEDRLFAYFFIGLTIGFTLINILLYFNSRDKIYLYYTVFIILQSVYYFRLTTYQWQYWTEYFPRFHQILTPIIQILINLFYLLFIQSFLKMDKDYPSLNKAVNIVIWFLTWFALLDLALLIFNPDFTYQPILLNAHRLIMTLFSIVGIIYLLLNRKSDYVYFIVIATTLFIGGALITLFSGEIRYMIVGGFMECSVFAAGLAYQIKNVNKQVIKVEKDAILLGKTALRAQLNPHFIFNALSSIQYLMSNNDHENATLYLDKFSLLIRQILENSFEYNVPLFKEIELLKRYVEIEALRFNNDFHYEFYVDDSIDQYTQEIPIFLIQPYIENSIIHGLVPKNGDSKRLKIIFEDTTGYIKCTVEDNGIGRIKSQLNNGKISHQSHGLSIAQKRIDMINEKNGQKTEIDYIDSESGTSVIINIAKN